MAIASSPQSGQRFPRMTPGDRFPDFIFPDQEGTNRQFYNEVRGGPILLLVARSVLSAAGATALQALVARQAEIASLGADLFALTADPVSATAVSAQAMGADCRIFSDGKSELVSLLLPPTAPVFPQTQAEQPEFALFLLDPNQRLLERLAAVAPDAMGAGALEALRGYVGAEVPSELQLRAAPVLILPRVFEPDLCERLIAAWRQEHHEGTASTGSENVYAPDRKRTLEHLVQDPELQRQIQRNLVRRVGPELAKVFGFRARYGFDGHVVMSYLPERGDFFGMHRDNLRGDSPRRFALSLNLNDSFEGGGLRFPEYSPHIYRMPAGGAAVFSCALLHEALPVTQGQRFVMTSFFCDVAGPASPTA